MMKKRHKTIVAISSILIVIAVLGIRQIVMHSNLQIDADKSCLESRVHAVPGCSQEDCAESRVHTVPPTTASDVVPSGLTSPLISDIPTEQMPHDELAHAPNPLVSSRREWRDTGRQIHSLPHSRNRRDIEAAYAFLLEPGIPAGMADWQYFGLANRIMDRLCLMPGSTSDFGRILCDIFNDPEQHSVIRDYAIQHMSQCYTAASDEDKTYIRETLWRAVNDPLQTASGTGLLTLKRLSSRNQGIDPTEIKDAALNFVCDAKCDDAVRISAIQLCAEMNQKLVVPELRELAVRHRNTLVRIAAIAALGRLGGEEEQILLQRISEKAPPRQQQAAKTALIRMGNERTAL